MGGDGGKEDRANKFNIKSDSLSQTQNPTIP